MFTLVAFQESITTGSSLEEITGLDDPHVRVSADDIYVPRDLPNLGGCLFVGATTITQAQISSPSLRRLANIDIAPFDDLAAPGSPSNLYNLFASPRPLEATEGLRAKLIDETAGYDECLVWFTDGPLAPVTGPIFTVRATNTTALTNYVWCNRPLTFSQTLPMGRYQVVGMRATSTGLLAARLVMTGYSWRPGCIGHDDVADPDNECFRGGRLGVWGEFEHDTPPTVDFLSVSADEDMVVHLDLIKVG